MAGVNVGTAYLTVIPSARGFAGKLQAQLGGGMAAAGSAAGDQFGQGFGSRLRTVAKTAFVGLLAGGGVALGGLATLGIKTAAANEQAQISFTTMLGSAQKAGTFLKGLQEFAASTPFEFPELQKAASSLISAGINADKVIPIMRTLGDVTSGMGTGSEGVRRATIALQQMSAAGRITGEDLNQLRDAGIPVYDLLAKATGKSKAEVVKLAQAGKLGSKELGQMMKALETGKGLERFSGLMDKQSASLTGLFSTFKDTLGQGLANAVQPLIPLLKDGLGKAATFLTGVLPKVSSAIADVIEAFKFGNEWESKSWLETVAVGARRVVDAMKQFVTEFRAGEGAAGTFRDVLSAVAKVVVIVATAGAALVGWLIRHQKATMAAVAAVAALVAITKIHAAVMAVQAAGGIIKFIQATKIVTALTRTWTAVQWLMNAALTANPIGIVIVAIAALVAGIIIAYKKSETFRSIVKAAFEGIQAAARFMWNNVLAPIIRFIVKGFANVAEGVATFLRALSNIPGFGWAKKAADAMQKAADKARGLADGINDIPDKKKVTVSVGFTQTGRITLPDGSKVNIGQRATGGPVAAGRPYIVGEREPELFVPKTAGTIYNQEQLAAMGRGRGGLTRADIQALVVALERAQLNAVVSAGTIDRSIGAGLR